MTTQVKPQKRFLLFFFMQYLFMLNNLGGKSGLADARGTGEGDAATARGVLTWRSEATDDFVEEIVAFDAHWRLRYVEEILDPAVGPGGITFADARLSFEGARQGGTMTCAGAV